jgi:diacylglycerol kinase (ATP)
MQFRILFIINPGSGNRDTDWPLVINKYFSSLDHTIELYRLTKDCSVQTIREKIIAFSPQQVIAVGGDGTVRMIAECLLQKNIALGILPAGSANGLAKELGISEDPATALEILLNGGLKKIHVIRINGQLCIHLADIGFNAFVIKKFESRRGRGMWGYIMASVSVLLNRPLMDVEMQIGNKVIRISAAMIVIANATKYGSGAVINPVGKLDDECFEVIAVKKISLGELFKMTVSHASYDREKTEIFQTNTLTMRSVKKAHFQVDGEYLGRVNEIKANLVPHALEIIVPEG